MFYQANTETWIYLIYFNPVKIIARGFKKKKSLLYLYSQVYWCLMVWYYFGERGGKGGGGAGRQNYLEYIQI